MPQQERANLGPADRSIGVTELLERMRAGDRAAAAEFMTRYGPMIRRRIRGKLRPSMRRLFDSQEILSTVVRRLDRFVSEGKLSASNERQLWGLVLTMAEHAVLDKARIFRRLREVEGEDGGVARMLATRLRQAERPGGDGLEIGIARVLDLLDDGVDRQILQLWLLAKSLNVIARDVALSPAAVRKRWQSIRTRLQRSLGAEGRS